MKVNPDFRDLLSAFNVAGVRFLIVGGYALAYHAHPRFTKDLDLLIEPTPENARRVHEALRSFGAPLSGVGPEDFASEGTVFQMGMAPNRIDVMTAIDGVSFAEAWDGRSESRYGDQPAPVLGRAELIKNKRASGRPQDLVDVDLLEKDSD
jgi:hypothetical protein